VKIPRFGEILTHSFCNFYGFYAEKGIGTGAANENSENGLTGKTDSLEFADCYHKETTKRKVYEAIP
jgi:hypothetical protein